MPKTHELELDSGELKTALTALHVLHVTLNTPALRPLAEKAIRDAASFYGFDQLSPGALVSPGDDLGGQLADKLFESLYPTLPDRQEPYQPISADLSQYV